MDGDNIGQILTNLIYSKNNNEELVAEFSRSVENSFKRMEKWVKENKGYVIFCAGDSIVFKIQRSLFDDVLEQIKPFDFNVTVGVGNTLKQAHWSLNIAKSLGKNRVLMFEDIKNEFFYEG